MGSSGISSLTSGAGQYSEVQRDQFKKTKEAGLDAAADALGESPDDLQDELQGGKSLADVAKDHGVSPDSVLDAVKQAVKSSDANLSDDQVNNISNRIVSGPHGHHHHGGGHAPEATPPTSPDDTTLPEDSTISVKA